MLLFEMLVTVSVLFSAWVYFESKSMGLHGDLPPDGPGRSRHYASRILHSLKEQLCRATLLEVTSQHVVFRHSGQSPRRIWCQAGSLWLQNDQQEPIPLHTMGEGGRVSFRQIAPDCLHIDVLSHAEPLHAHSFSLRLPMLRRTPV